MLTDIKYVNYFHNRRQDRGGVAGGGILRSSVIFSQTINPSTSAEKRCSELNPGTDTAASSNLARRYVLWGVDILLQR